MASQPCLWREVRLWVQAGAALGAPLGFSPAAPAPQLNALEAGMSSWTLWRSGPHTETLTP